MSQERERNTTSSSTSHPPQVSNESRTRPSPGPPPGSSHVELKYLGIVFVGMNPDASVEGKLLFEENRDHGFAKQILDSDQPNHVKAGNLDFDLGNEAGIRAYLQALNVESAILEELVELLLSQGFDAQDEVGQLIQVYLQAERGERRMDRVVISGHSSGGVVWGDENGLINFLTFETLARLFPKAAGQVRDVMISACYSGGERQLEQYFRMFPRVESIWAYAGSSPGANSGAQEHMRIWERATVGDDPAQLDPALAAGTRKGENVATWTATGGYHGDEPITLWEAQLRVRQGEAVFQRFYEGHEEVADPQSGPLRDYYNAVQRLLRFADSDITGQIASLEQRRDVTLRLLFYGSIRTRFMAAYGPQIRQGYAEVASVPPDYEKLSRGEALASIAAFGASAGQGKAAQAALDLLEKGVRDLSPSIITATWI